MDKGTQSALEHAAAAINKSRYLVAFTGAGLSVESGIPPFRGPGGLWEEYDPAMLDIGYFHTESASSWSAIKTLFYDHWGNCQPNQAHQLLAEWEAKGRLHFIITQNIDDLHYRAGSRNIAEYHGSMRELRCLRCDKSVPASSVPLDQLPPRCSCGGIYKPDFVFFGEAIPPQAALQSIRAINACDCVLLIGTSGEVYPAAALPRTAKTQGATVIEINPRSSLYTDSIVDYYLPFGAVEGMRALDQACNLTASGPSE